MTVSEAEAVAVTVSEAEAVAMTVLEAEALSNDCFRDCSAAGVGIFFDCLQAAMLLTTRQLNPAAASSADCATTTPGWRSRCAACARK